MFGDGVPINRCCGGLGCLGHRAQSNIGPTCCGPS